MEKDKQQELDFKIYNEKSDSGYFFLFLPQIIAFINYPTF